MNYKKALAIFFSCIIIYIFFTSGVTTVPAEKIAVPSTIGFDIERKGSEIIYSLPIAVYNYTGTEIPSTLVHTGSGKTLGATREDRQLESDLKFLLGLEKTLIWSEAISRYGIQNTIDILFANPNINDTGLNVVCKGKPIHILNLHMEGYPNAGDYIEGVLTHAKEFNFFSDNYKLMDIYVRVGAEGRSLVLPYIEVVNKIPKITGMALFDGDKMITSIGIQDAKLLNILRENNVKGMLSLMENSREYIDYYCTSKRKVTCEKTNNKYKFTIDLSINGDIINNTLYKDIATNPNVQKKFINDMEGRIKQLCYEFLDKMQNDYEIDCLSLGKVAVAKYGRHTGTDWVKAVCEADIVVNVEVKLDRFGRGNYY